MTRLLKTALALSLLTAALSIGTAPAAAGQACWQRLINDWYDGRIDKTYPVKCYQDAIKNVPEEGESYTSLPDDLRRALTLALRPRGGNTPKGSGTPTKPTASGRIEERSDLKPNAIVPAGAKGRATAKAGGVAGAGTGPSGPFGEAFAPPTDRADSIPLPLIIMAALALLLMAAGGAGMVSRRVQARRVPVPATPGTRRDAPPAPQE